MASNATQIFVDIIARDKASKSLAKSAITLGAFGAAAIRFGKDSIKAYSESEDAVNKLVFAHEKFPKVADVSVKSLDDLSLALQKKTIYDDEATKSAEATLAQFNLTGKQIEQLIPLVQDYASVTGQDLQSATVSIGKAFAGNAKALKSIGINFHATGDITKDYATIQADLNEKVGGFAEKQGKTAAGQAQILANHFNDLQEEVGSLLVPALTNLAGIADELVKGFTALPKPVQDLVIGAAAIAGISLVVIPRLILIKDALEEIFGAGEEAATGLGATAAGETAVGANAVRASTKVDRMVTAIGRTAGLSLLVFALSKAFGKTADEAGAADEAVAAFSSTDADAKLKAITKQLQVFPDIFGRSWSQMFQSVTHSDDVLAHLGVTADDISKHLGGNDQQWQKYKQSLLDASDAAKYNGSTTLLLARNLDLIHDSAHEATKAQEVLGHTMDEGTHKIDDQTKAYGELTKKLSDYVDNLENSTRAGFKKRQADRDAIKTIKEMGKSSKQSGQEVDDAFSAILDAADAARDAVQGAANKNVAYRAELIKLRSHVVKGSPLYTALSNYITKLHGIPEAVNTQIALSFTVQGLHKAVQAGQALHNASMQKQQIHPFAKGGWVDGPKGQAQLAIVHGGEYVLSNDMLAGHAAANVGGASSGFGDINIYLPAGPYLADKRAVTAWVQDALSSAGVRGTATVKTR